MLDAKWSPMVDTYYDPSWNNDIARAQSILSGPDFGVCPPLTIDQARDVLTWYNGVHLK